MNYLIFKGLSIYDHSHIGLRRSLFIPEILCEMRCEMNEWMRSFSAKTMATENRLQSQTKCFTFNPKIYYSDNAENWNKKMN
jgi:hypothetical protein